MGRKCGPPICLPRNREEMPWVPLHRTWQTNILWQMASPPQIILCVQMAEFGKFFRWSVQTRSTWQMKVFRYTEFILPDKLADIDFIWGFQVTLLITIQFWLNIADTSVHWYDLVSILIVADIAYVMQNYDYSYINTI